MSAERRRAQQTHGAGRRDQSGPGKFPQRRMNNGILDLATQTMAVLSRLYVVGQGGLGDRGWGGGGVKRGVSFSILLYIPRKRQKGTARASFFLGGGMK